MRSEMCTVQTTLDLTAFVTLAVPFRTADHKCRCNITHVYCVSAICIKLNCLFAIMLQLTRVSKLGGQGKQEED